MVPEASFTTTSHTGLSTAHSPYLYLWSEQTAADSVPQTGPCVRGFPWSRVSLFLYTTAGLIQTLLLVRITLTHSFWHEPLSTLKCYLHWLMNKQTKKAALLHRYHRLLKHGTNKSCRSFFPEQPAIDRIALKDLEELHWCSWIFAKPSVPSSLLSIVPVGVRKGTKPLPTTLASVLFHFPDGFGGLTPENPLLPSLPTCSRLPLWVVLAGNLASQVA